jgi:hypothetical protein
MNRHKKYFVGLVLVVFLAAIGWQLADKNSIDSNPTRKVIAPMPNLDGDKAKDYLEKQGLSESLGEAIKIARYSVNRVREPGLERYG